MSRRPPLEALEGVLEQRLASAVVLALLAAAALLALLQPIVNGDIGWHVALGRLMARHGTIPQAEPFTWTARGAPMVAHEWLSQWLYWQIAERFGLAGLRWGHAALGAAMVVLLFALLRRAQVSRPLALLACAVWLLLAEGRLQVRPHLLTMAFTIAFYGPLLLPRRPPGAGRIALATVAVALWANLHSGALIVPVLLWLDLAARVLAARVDAVPADGTHALRRRAALALACSAALLATPNHLRLLPYLLASRAANTSRSWEWLSILRYFGHERADPLALGLWLALVVASVLLAWRALRARRALPEAALAIFCALLPLAGIRWLWLSFVPLLFVSREAALALAARRLALRRHVHAAAVVAAAAVGAVALGPAEGVAHRLAAGRSPMPFDAASFPIGATRLLAELPLEGRLFAKTEWGGFLTLVLDERYPTFADGRWVTIGPHVVDEAHRIATRRRDALRLLERWGVDLLLVERGWLRGPDDPALEAWLPAFASYNALLLVRRDERGAGQRAQLARYYAALGIPFDPLRGFDARAAWEANHDWARAHRVRRKHVAHFRADGRHRDRGNEVVDWQARRPARPQLPPSPTGKRQPDERSRPLRRRSPPRRVRRRPGRDTRRRSPGRAADRDSR